MTAEKESFQHYNGEFYLDFYAKLELSIFELIGLINEAKFKGLSKLRSG